MAVFEGLHGRDEVVSWKTANVGETSQIKEFYIGLERFRKGQTVKLGPKSSTVDGNQLPYKEWYRLQICLFGRGSSRSTMANFGSSPVYGVLCGGQ